MHANRSAFGGIFPRVNCLWLTDLNCILFFQLIAVMSHLIVIFVISFVQIEVLKQGHMCAFSILLPVCFACIFSLGLCFICLFALF